MFHVDCSCSAPIECVCSMLAAFTAPWQSNGLELEGGEQCFFIFTSFVFKSNKILLIFLVKFLWLPRPNGMELSLYDCVCVCCFLCDTVVSCQCSLAGPEGSGQPNIIHIVTN